jgi:hypothetical protein
MGRECVDWIKLAQDNKKWRVFVCSINT